MQPTKGREGVQEEDVVRNMFPSRGREPSVSWAAVMRRKAADKDEEAQVQPQ